MARTEIGRLWLLGLACAVAIMLQAWVGYAGRTTGQTPSVVFWGSLALLYAVGWAVVASRGLSRSGTALAVVLIELSLQLTRYVLYPHMFVYHDELQHVRTLESILSLHKLFTPNSTLPVSALFPGIETATAGVASITGFSAHASGIIVLLAARLVMSLGMFAVFSRMLRSTRAAGVACLIYVANPQYLFFNSQFAYQTLALALSFGYVYLVVSLEDRKPLAAAAWLVPTALAIACTHHLTSWGITALLLAWAVLGTALHSRHRHLILGACAMAGCTGLWSLLQHRTLFPYLGEIFNEDLHSIAQLINGHTTHVFFKTTTADETPVAERYLSVASVLIIIGLLPPALWSARHWLRRRWVPALLLAVIALVYPLLPLGHLTTATSNLADRSSGFVFVGVAFVLSAWLLTTERAGRAWKAITSLRGTVPSLFMLGGLIVFIGGTIVGSGPPSLRAPGAYVVEGENRSVDRFALAAAAWEGRALPANGRIYSDRTNALLAAVVGNQHSVSAVSDHFSTFDLSRLLLAPLINADVSAVPGYRIDDIVVDTRLATAVPDVGIYTESGELGDGERTRPPSLAALTKFDVVPGASRVYDNGPIYIYDVRNVK